MGVAQAAPMPFLRDAVMEQNKKAVEHRQLTAGAIERPEPARGTVLPPAPRSSSCSRYVRRRIAARLPELCEALIDHAQAGDLRAAKLLWQMAELDRKPAGGTAGSGRTKTAVGFAQKALAEFRAR